MGQSHSSFKASAFWVDGFIWDKRHNFAQFRECLDSVVLTLSQSLLLNSNLDLKGNKYMSFPYTEHLISALHKGRGRPESPLKAKMASSLHAMDKITYFHQFCTQGFQLTDLLTDTNWRCMCPSPNFMQVRWWLWRQIYWGKHFIQIYCILPIHQKKPLVGVIILDWVWWAEFEIDMLGFVKIGWFHSSALPAQERVDRKTIANSRTLTTQFLTLMMGIHGCLVFNADC